MIQSRFRPIVAVALLAAAPHVVRGGEGAPWKQPPPENENAALVYWQAIALLPAWTEEQRPYVENSPHYDFVPEETAEGVFAASEPAMRLMRRAVRSPDCNWGTDLNDGPLAVFPHTSKVRQLTRVAAFRVLFQARTGQVEQAVDDGLAILGLARHLSRDRLLVSTWTGYAIEAQGVTALAEVVPQLDEAQLRELARRHAALPARPTIGDCIQSEKRAFLGWFARQVHGGHTDAALDAIALMAGNGSFCVTGSIADAKKPVESPWLRALRAEAREDPEILSKLLERTASLWDEAAKLADVSADEMPKKSAEWVDRLKDLHPLSAALLPPLSGCHDAIVRVNARQAILQAGIAHCLDRESGLQGHPEPFTGKPFTLHPVAGGFELRSDLGGRDPLVVSFGRAIR